MSKVIMFSRVFPSYHPRKGESTHFVEQIWNSLNVLNLPVPKNAELPDDFMWSILPLVYYGFKYHTIRDGNRFMVGDSFSPRVWSGKPYRSKQIVIAPDIKVKRIWKFEIKCERNSDSNGDVSNFIYINDKLLTWNDYPELVKNDGLSLEDFLNWFEIEGDGEECKPQSFSGQIISWSNEIYY